MPGPGRPPAPRPAPSCALLRPVLARIQLGQGREGQVWQAQGEAQVQAIAQVSDARVPQLIPGFQGPQLGEVLHQGSRSSDWEPAYGKDCCGALPTAEARRGEAQGASSLSHGRWDADSETLCSSDGCSQSQCGAAPSCCSARPLAGAGPGVVSRAGAPARRAGPQGVEWSSLSSCAAALTCMRVPSVRGWHVYRSTLVRLTWGMQACLQQLCRRSRCAGAAAAGRLQPTLVQDCKGPPAAHCILQPAVPKLQAAL